MNYHSLRQILLGVAAALALARPAAAVPSFVSSNTVLSSTLTVQSIVALGNGNYRMYVTSGSFRVLSAISNDQVVWSTEAGIRLSTGVGGSDASSITAVGVVQSTDPALGWRMYYVGVDAGGLYRVLSASSTDGLGWTKQTTTHVVNNAGRGFIGSLSPFQASSTLLRLYYVADKDGLNVPAGFQVHSASSTDGGVNFSTEGVTLAANAYAVSATTITGGKTRIFFTNPLTGSTTAAQVLSATASDGLSFTQESGTRLSTSSSVSALLGLAVLRATETWRWRMFTSYTVGGTTSAFIAHALTQIPVVDSFTPRLTLKGQASVAYTVTGEIFSPAPAVSFVLSASTFNAATVVRTDDTALFGTLSTVNRSAGRYTAAVTNSDGQSGLLDSILEIELPPGQVSILDNLFRPLKGGKAAITVDIFDPGDVTLRLYTVDGGLVATIYQGPLPAGPSTFNWNGRTPSGSVVASGVYLLHAQGPKLNTVERIVVIK